MAPKRTRLQMRAAAQKQQSAYRRKYPAKPVLSASQGGVAGGRARMRAGHLAPPPEVKFFDVPLTVASTSNWQFVNTDSIFSIIQGTGANERIGRKIRVKGIVIRALVNTAIGSTTFASPWTIDLLWDQQANGALPAVTEVYTAAAPTSLPNPLFDERFQFIKRVSNNDPNAQLNIVNQSVKCDKVITYDKNTGTIVDLSSTNLIISYCTPGDAIPLLDGTVRILYVDA